MKKTISLLLTFLMLLTVLPLGSSRAAAEEAGYAVGDVIEYGAYPQSRVTDPELIETLNRQPGEWQPCSLYGDIASTGPNVFFAEPFEGMRYLDAVVDGVKYRGIAIDEYRPFAVYGSENTSTQQENGYETGSVSWFRFDPIRWRVLEPGEGLVMCDVLIDSQPFAVYMDYYASYTYSGEYAGTYGEGGTGYWRNISAWLNEDFYETAFSAAQQENILVTELANDYWYVGGNGGVASHRYDAPACESKIFLPSWDELSNTACGFAANAKSADPARALTGTDYAKAFGLKTVAGGGAQWWMRTVGRYFNSRFACTVKADGSSAEFSYASDRDAWYGVCPAMRLAVLGDSSSGTALHTVGELIAFGSYPQTRVTDAETLASLTDRLSYAETHPLYSYIYDFHYAAEYRADYADMIVNGQKYRAKIQYYIMLREAANGVVPSAYPAADAVITEDGLTKYVYFYKFEPLIWRLLDPETGLMMCNSIVEAQVYQQGHYKDFDDYYADNAWTDEEHTHYATDYTVSNVRAFLTGDFYNTAFTDSQKANILTTELDNRCLNSVRGIGGFEEYDWETTCDKVFLLSSDEVLNPAYGFSEDAMTQDPARKLLGNDYAGYADPAKYNQYWALRTVNEPLYLSRRPGAVSYHGMVSCSAAWANELSAVCPALRLAVLESDFSGETAACTEHTPAVVSVTPASCTENGVGREVCAVCGAVLTETVVLPATGHTPGEAVTENVSPATCKQPGSYEEVVYCVACGDELSRTPKTSPVIPHTPGEAARENEIFATCTAFGSYDEVVYCTVCGDELSRTPKTSPMLPHTPGQTVRENEIVSTCTAPGSYEEAVYCEICGNELSRAYKTSPLKPHTLGAWQNEQPADCSHTGVKGYAQCSACGGYFDLNGDPIADLTIQKDKTRHAGEMTVQNAREATCAAEGYTGDTVCSACGDVVKRGTAVEKKAHQWNGGDVTTPASCTSDGVRTYRCQKCTATKTERIPAAGHNWSAWTLAEAPTCTSEGREIRVCANNASHTETRKVSKIAHEDGNGDGYCDMCGTSLSSQSSQGESSADKCPYCGKVHTGPFGGVIAFFHRIAYFFAHLFGAM